MKKITITKRRNLIYLMLFLLSSIATINAQCIRTNEFLNVVSNNSGNVQDIAVCSYTSAEFNSLTGLIVGGTYQFISRAGTTYGAGAENFVTITDDTNNVIAFGTSPLTVTNITSANVRLHHASDASCGGTATCNNSQLQYLPTCGIPNTLTSSAITLTTATISWVAPTTAPSGGYNFYYSTVNTAPIATTTPSGSTAAGVTTANLTGLTDSTTYFFWVRSNCGSEFSAWSSFASFATSCTPGTVPYTENFESVTVNALPSCTSAVNYGTGNIWTTATAPGNGFTTKTLRYAYNFSSPADTWFYTRALNLTAGTSYRISYNYGNNYNTYAESLKVAYGTSSDPSSMTNVLANHPTINTATIQFNQVDFTPTTTGVYYFGFQAYSIANQFYLFVDNITVTLTPACSAPINLAASAITVSSATLTWDSVASATNYEYVLDTTAADPSVAGTSTNATTYNAAGLLSLTTYYFHVRTNCSGTSSAWSTVMFTTLQTPPVNDECSSATLLTAGNVYNSNPVDGTNIAATTSSQAATTTCNGFSGGDVWYSVVVPANGTLTIETGNPSTASTGIDTVITVYSGTDCSSLTEIGCDDDGGTGAYSLVSLTGLTPSATLYIRVYEYLNDSFGNYSISAYDASLATTSFNATNFTAYPNPVKDILNLSYAKNITKVQVNNILGQEVLSKNMNSSETQIDLSVLAKGTYLVKVTADDLVKTLKIIKE